MSGIRCEVLSAGEARGSGKMRWAETDQHSFWLGQVVDVVKCWYLTCFVATTFFQKELRTRQTWVQSDAARRFIVIITIIKFNLGMHFNIQ